VNLKPTFSTCFPLPTQVFCPNSDQDAFILLY